MFHNNFPKKSIKESRCDLIVRKLEKNNGKEIKSLLSNIVKIAKQPKFQSKGAPKIKT